MAALATVPVATTEAIGATPTPVPLQELGIEDQLALFDELTATIEDVYLDPDYGGVDWEGLVTDTREMIAGGMGTGAFYAELDVFIAALGDEHSHFESPPEVAAAEARLAGEVEWVGIGVLVQPIVEKDYLTVLATFPGSPAELGGLQPHDIIYSVDGVPLVEDGVAFPFRVRGPECTAVVLVVQSPGEEPRAIQFVRHRITNSVPNLAHLVPTNDGSRVGYIFLPTFFDETVPDRVRQALEKLAPLDGLILDNRMNGGGSSTVLERILGFFTSGSVGTYVSRSEDRPLEIDAEPVANSHQVPLVVLVGPETVSFGEIFAGILQDLGRAWIVGETTPGNVETLNGYGFFDGSKVWIADERFDPLYTDADWEAQGIVPDVEVIADWETFTFETDPAIAAALGLLGH